MAAFFLVFGVLFVWSASYVPELAPTRLITGGFLFLAGFGILYYTMKQRPVQITQKLEVPGEMKVKMLRCPNCSAALDIKQIKIVDGVPSITCSYCGHTFEVTEEPKW